MFEFYQNTLCVNGGWLYNDADVMSIYNYKNLINRKAINVLRRGGNGRSALVSFESIPERFKNLIIEKFGDPYKTTQNSKFIDYLEQDATAVAYYKNYTLDNGSALPDKNINEYIANATVLNTIGIIVNNRTAKSKALGGKSTKLWDKMANIIQNLPKHTFPHSLPKNVRRLKQKYKAYKSNGYEALIHKGFCNDNSEKINEEAKFWVVSRWADRVFKVATLDQLLFEYNQLADKKGWKTLKEEKTLRIYLNKNGVKHLWYGHRYGDSASKEKFVYQHSTKLPSMRDSLWYSDGTKLNYFYLDENGKVATCQVYEVIDAFSEVFLGFHVSKTEDYKAQFKAYKMAIQVSEHKPYQIGFDGQGGHKKLKAGDFLGKIARLSIKTAPYNGKSKTIESAFGRFQARYLKQDWFFTGQNITTKKLESKAQREFINANIKELPTLPQVIEIYKKRRAEWNQAPHPKTGVPRLEMYRNSINPKTTKIGMWDMVDLFWITRTQTNTVTPYGISFKEQGAEYNYMVYDDNNLPNVEWLRINVDKKVTIKFDPDDMSMVYLYEKDALGLRFLTEAKTKVEIHRGKQEQEDWEPEYIAKVKILNDNSRIDADEKMDQLLEDHNMLPEQHGLRSPQLLGVKSKRKKAPNTIGKVQKKESNMVVINDDSEDISIYDMM